LPKRFVTAPQFLALQRREHVVGGGAANRGPAAGALRVAVLRGVASWSALTMTAARGARESVVTVLNRGA
jgi:hypothetical protein